MGRDMYSVSVDSSGRIFLDGAVLENVWSVGNVDEGIEEILAAAETDPLLVVYQTDQQAIVRWALECLSELEEPVLGSANFNGALYQIMKSPALRLYLTKRALLSFAEGGKIGYDVLKELGVPDSRGLLIGELRENYFTERAAIERRIDGEAAGPEDRGPQAPVSGAASGGTPGGTDVELGEFLLPDASVKLRLVKRPHPDYKDAFSIIAFEGGDRVGDARCQVNEGSDAVRVARLDVEFKRKGKGIGTLLMRMVVDEARRIGRRYARLSCEATNWKGLRFYETLPRRIDGISVSVGREYLGLIPVTYDVHALGTVGEKAAAPAMSATAAALTAAERVHAIRLVDAVRLAGKRGASGVPGAAQHTILALGERCIPDGMRGGRLNNDRRELFNSIEHLCRVNGITFVHADESRLLAAIADTKNRIGAAAKVIAVADILTPDFRPLYEETKKEKLAPGRLIDFLVGVRAGDCEYVCIPGILAAALRLENDGSVDPDGAVKVTLPPDSAYPGIYILIPRSVRFPEDEKEKIIHAILTAQSHA